MKFIFAFLAAAIPVSACTSSSSTPPATQHQAGGDGGAASTCKQYSACSLVSAQAVGQAFGTAFDAGTESDPNPTPSPTLAEEVQCAFAGTDGWNVSVSVRCCPCNDNDPQSVESEDQTLGEATTAVSGIGDTAFWAAPGPDAGFLSNAYTLNAFVGASLYVTVNVTTPPSTPDPEMGAETIAKAVVSGL
jgi:hypothetical protein